MQQNDGESLPKYAQFIEELCAKVAGGIVVFVAQNQGQNIWELFVEERNDRCTGVVGGNVQAVQHVEQWLQQSAYTIHGLEINKAEARVKQNFDWAEMEADNYQCIGLVIVRCVQIECGRCVITQNAADPIERGRRWYNIDKVADLQAK